MPIPESQRLARSLIVAAAVAAILTLTGVMFQRAIAAQAKPSQLQTVINQMNAASQKFTSAQADIRQELFTRIPPDTVTQAGQIYFLRKGSSTQMGMKILPPDARFGAQPAQIVEFKDGKLRVLSTGTSQIDEFTASGKNQPLAETLMTLGFGGSGTDLQKAWTITDRGQETINDSTKPVQVEKLDLVSKDASIRDNYSHITIWVDPIRDVSLKQMLFGASGGGPTGDTRTAYYSNIRVNQPVNTAPFAIKCTGKCALVQH